MKLIAPSYYTNFYCIADKCNHNCCIGWEIDIDNKTNEYYKFINGSFGKQLNDNIEFTDDIPHFRLDENERCPFLNKNNLCDIILTLGEDKLCQICKDHPRFRNYFKDRTEIGLGLCCEEAARLILSYKEKVTLTKLKSDSRAEDIPKADSAFFQLRDEIFKLLQNREKTVDERINDVMVRYDITLPEKTYNEWSDIYLELERLDATWTDKLHSLKKADISNEKPQELEYEQLLIYFIYRHLADGLYDGKIKECIAFAILSLKIIRGLCSVCDDNIIEIARMYSSEIEYSDENMEELLNLL